MSWIDSSNTKIKYKETPFEFVIRNPKNSYEEFDYQFTLFSPDFIKTKFLPEDGWGKFDGVIDAFSFWLKKHISEYIQENRQEDLWIEYKKNSTSLNLDNLEFDEKDSFTNDEQKQIGMALDELKLLIKNNFNTTKEQQSVVINRLDYLSDACIRLNKFDWKSIAISTMISISIALTLDAEQGQLLFSLFKKVINALPKLIMGN